MNAVILLALIGADDPVATPKGPPPQMAFVKVAGGKIVRSVTVTVPVAVEREVEVIVGGKTEKRKVVETRLETATKEMAVPTDKATFSTAGGKKLDLDAAKKAIGDGAVVLMSANGEAVDAAYMKAFKADTVVMVVPGGGGVGGPGVMPLPVPLPPRGIPRPIPIIRPLPPRPAVER